MKSVAGCLMCYSYDSIAKFFFLSSDFFTCSEITTYFDSKDYSSIGGGSGFSRSEYSTVLS